MPRFYTKDHEWIDVDSAQATVGITDYAQSQLGDITFVDLPATGTTLKAGETACVVDSVKAASDVFAPVTGTISEGNETLADAPELVNTDAEAAGWLFRMTLSDPAEVQGLMDETAYKAYVAGL